MRDVQTWASLHLCAAVMWAAAVEWRQTWTEAKR